MGSINKQISRYEFTAVYSHPEAKVDIVLVHGLNGNPEKTWTAKNGVYWPADLLPTSLRNAHANVLVYGYNADVYSSRNDRSASDNFIHQHAQTLVTSLTHYRKSEDSMRNPIIWIAHSLGGILTKRALLYSNDLRVDYHEDYRSVFVSTYGIIFLGTPHTGTDIATWGHMLQSMSDVVMPRKFFDTEPILLKTLKRDNETLQAINSHFLDIYQRFRIHMAHENHKTDVKGTKIMVVDAASASPQLPGVTYYGIEASHSNMCKFDNSNAPGWRIVSTAIREWVLEAPQVILVRWKVEEDDRALRAGLENFERMRPYDGTLSVNTQPGAIVGLNNEMTFSSQISSAAVAAPPPLPLLPAAVTGLSEMLESQTKSEPVFVHPEQFRPNSYFIGRDDELRNLHRMLTDRKRRLEGSSAVLIQCLPGGGKTHLARQYVFQHRQDYLGGVYWVRAKSREEMEYWYWRIAEKEVLRDIPEQTDESKLREPKKVVEMVRKWLNGRENWLLVFDGVQFDMPGFGDFIPDARNTSIIFTSTERAVTGDHRFDNPQVMELGLLSPQDAQELLLLEMNKKQPWTQEDKVRARELVQLMGWLPLMIHVAAQHLKATREPLSKYLRAYKSRPKVGGLTAYRGVREQLEHRGANAALNLISILVFFDQHIPVEMVTLGLSALDNVTPVKTSDASHTKTTLINTLQILMTFALVERTDSDDSSSTSSQTSTKNGADRNGPTLDLLRIHSVVQAFFIDTLMEERQVQFWLERAVAVWCRSYDEADKRIQEDSKVGIPDDYRRFSIHGKKLVGNLTRFEKRAPELLSRCRRNVESRLSKVPGKLEQLSHTYQPQAIDGSGEVPSLSVFERTSSASETDSSSTPHSQSSLPIWVPSLRDSDGSSEHEQTPTLYLPPDQPDPYHWHIPYPHIQSLMPESPNPDLEDVLTVVPEDYSPLGSIVVDNNVAGRLFQRSRLPILDGSLQPVKVDQPPAHRVAERNEARRYHDRVGSWRDSTMSDPRVSISRELAKGSISSSQPLDRNAPNNAAAHLGKINRIAPPQSEVEAFLDAKSRRSLSSGTISRPRSILGRNSYANFSASQTVEAAGPPEFSTSPSSMITTPSSWTSATLKRLKENLSTVVAEPDDRQVSQKKSNEQLIPPGPIFRGSRTSGSSHASKSVSSALVPLTVEAATVDAPQTAPARVQRWDTAGFHPVLDRVDSSSLGVGIEQNPLSLSFPSPSPPTAYPLRVALPAQTRPITPTGYSSQPMSRNSSRPPSTHSMRQKQVNIDHHMIPLIPGSPMEVPDLVYVPSHTTHQSSPLAGSPLSRTSDGLLVLQDRSRKPSYTNTETSPRLSPVFLSADPGYGAPYEPQLIETSPTSSVVPNGSVLSLPTVSAESLPTVSRWRFIRGGFRGRGRATGRSQSASPSAGPRRLRKTIPGPVVAVQGSYGSASPPDSEYAFRRGSTGSTSVRGLIGSAPVSRAGSAGIAVGNGRIVEFGAALEPSPRDGPPEAPQGVGLGIHQ